MFRGVESVTEAREKLGLELLVDRRKAAHIYLLIKIIGDDKHSLLMDRFDSLYKGSHSHYTRSASSNNNPCALPTNKTFYFNSFLPRTFRDIGGEML